MPSADGVEAVAQKQAGAFAPAAKDSVPLKLVKCNWGGTAERRGTATHGASGRMCSALQGANPDGPRLGRGLGDEPGASCAVPVCGQKWYTPCVGWRREPGDGAL